MYARIHNVFVLLAFYFKNGVSYNGIVHLISFFETDKDVLILKEEFCK